MMRLKRPKALIAGPWLSELGWEIMVWQAAVRFQRTSKRYRETYVITFRDREILYEDCALFAHDGQLITAEIGIGVASRRTTRKLVRACVEHHGIQGDFDLFTPGDYLSIPSRIMRKVRADKLFRKFRVPPVDDRRFDMAFHFRAFERQIDASPKSFSLDAADALVERCLSRRMRVCCIGAPRYSYVAKGADNRQTQDLSSAIATICASRLVVGGSSGPMHLALHCGVPIVVWISSPPGAERYFTFGNPFGSRVFLVTERTFNPGVEDIFSTIETALAQI